MPAATKVGFPTMFNEGHVRVKPCIMMLPMSLRIYRGSIYRFLKEKTTPLANNCMCETILKA